MTLNEESNPMITKSYGFAEIAVTDPEAYKDYIARSGPAVAAAGGRFLVRGGDPRVVEGGRSAARIILVEFDAPDGADRFYQSPPYQDALPYRLRTASSHYYFLQGSGVADADRVPAASDQPRGYVFAEVYPQDLERYMEYPKLSTPIAARFGGRFIVRGGAPRVAEGDRSPQRIVIAEFPTARAAHDFYWSPEYQEALAYRQRYSTGHVYLLTGA